MDWIVIALVIVVMLAIVVVKLSQKQGAQPSEYPYRKIDVLFSPAERSFFGVLNQAAGENTQIFGKVRVADVIAPKKGMSRSDWQKSFNKISGKHFDFLLCNTSDLSVLCALELNDSSHNSKKRKDRDAFLEGACQAANVPLIKISARSTYNINEIQQSLAAYLPGSMSSDSTQESVEAVIEHQPSGDEKSCPKCSSTMVKKIAKRGKNVGNEFWACSAFPKCRHIEAINA
ncbi:MAG: DUF2726 domain-containing protein [Gammaproteobacteria bacterium]|nr:DUF2726 domain-containing protein [Gammaproteobacteria bacterium]